MAQIVAAEDLILCGGLRVTDTVTGAVVTPGCCAGLEDWRTWAAVLGGRSPWLGHDPTPEVEIGVEELRVWQDTGAHRRAAESVVVPRPLLPGLLNGVHRDLVAFLPLVRRWADRIGLGDNGSTLVEAIDRDFEVTAPFPIAAE
ncbi:hypothetical protein [Nocardia sp. NPDC050435]|uniref:hypothetical protein n=1 Tax=Nocardia sp. NPDC050435 TaxID=3155040 RepID=UPI0033D40A01